MRDIVPRKPPTYQCCSICNEKKALSQFPPGITECKKCRKTMRDAIRLQQAKINHCASRICPQCGWLRISKSYPKGSEICKFCTEKLHRLASPTPLPKEAKKYQKSKALLHKYGLSYEEYELLFLEQFGFCAICGEAPPDEKLLHIDHDHATGKVRGLLCNSCNLLLGRARDDINILKNAIKYLKKHST